MMTIDKLEPTLEKMTERLRNLSFSFYDADLGKEADDARDEAIAAIESYLELAVQDWEDRPDADDKDEET